MSGHVRAVIRIALVASSACVDTSPDADELATPWFANGNFSYTAANTSSAQQNTASRTVTLAAGDRLTVATCGLAGASFTGDTYLRLFDPSGTQVAVDDDACGGLGSSLTYTAVVAGDHAIHAGCFSSSTCGGTVVYQVASTSGSFTFSASNTNSAQQNTAVFAVPLDAGDRIVVATCGLSGASFTGDTYLRLFGGGAQVAFSDDACGGLGSSVTYRAATAGTLEIHAGCYGGGTCSGVVAFRVVASARLTVGTYSSCEVVSGTVRCWGYNANGQLGDGTTTAIRSSPEWVLQSLGGIQSVVAGGQHTCALLASGGVSCWGANESGQLGDGTTTERHTPVPVLQSPGGAPLTGVQALSLGFSHSCALLAGGVVECWGRNREGELGDGTTTNRSNPVAVRSAMTGVLTAVRDISVGEWQACALMSGGDVQCWGTNDHGQLGDGTTTNRTAAVSVLKSSGGPPLVNAQSVSVGYQHACAQLVGGEVRCWGDNSSGELGDGTTISRLTPVAVLKSPGGPTLTGVQDISLGGGFSCARFSAGDLACWGANDSGELGDGTTTARLTPVAVVLSPGGPPLTGVQTIGLGLGSACAEIAALVVRCWGNNSLGQLGDGTTTSRSLPASVAF
jgi:alpha-tubulin suppressor-like RCC1 family protein